ncbi:hypothetical protein NUW54_g8041 [Trametes sanguinea]|uniref:Uncharacterized protein n=1 Tax=Trametes sanguinea TaxID=158606 RepID=A0ACC1PG54_9APHY|nr:hypothetical protein NUW54_g8041 [Trametes sanguinea]
MLTTLTRSQFEEACRRYVDAHSGEQCHEVKTYPSGWSWHEHSYVPGLGYLARTVRLPRTTPSEAEMVNSIGLDEIAEQEDNTTASAAHEILTCRQYVVYSPTYAVPAFYFTLHDSSACKSAPVFTLRSNVVRLHSGFASASERPEDPAVDGRFQSVYRGWRLALRGRLLTGRDTFWPSALDASRQTWTRCHMQGTSTHFALPVTTTHAYRFGFVALHDVQKSSPSHPQPN